VNSCSGNGVLGLKQVRMYQLHLKDKQTNDENIAMALLIQYAGLLIKNEKDTFEPV